MPKTVAQLAIIASRVITSPIFCLLQEAVNKRLQIYHYTYHKDHNISLEIEMKKKIELPFNKSNN